MIAHIEINSGYPWVNEFFGHPHEYWPIYLLVAMVISLLAYLTVTVHRLQNLMDASTILLIDKSSAARGDDEHK